MARTKKATSPTPSTRKSKKSTAPTVPEAISVLFYLFVNCPQVIPDVPDVPLCNRAQLTKAKFPPVWLTQCPVEWEDTYTDDEWTALRNHFSTDPIEDGKKLEYRELKNVELTGFDWDQDDVTKKMIPLVEANKGRWATFFDAPVIWLVPNSIMHYSSSICLAPGSPQGP